MADRFTGPAVNAQFEAEGATVIADTDSHRTADRPGRCRCRREARRRPRRNLVARWPPAAPTETTDERGLAMFDALVHPTMRFVRAVLPQMFERRAAKIIVVTSAAPLRATPHSDAYSAALRAQNGYVESVDADVARHNVQLNAIARPTSKASTPSNAKHGTARTCSQTGHVPRLGLQRLLRRPQQSFGLFAGAVLAADEQPGGHGDLGVIVGLRGLLRRRSGRRRTRVNG